MNEKLVIIVPCYNEEAVLPIFYKEVTRVLKTINKKYEILLINDGSSDNTLQIMKQLSDSDERVFYISLSRNFGKEAAIYAGFCNVKGDYIAIMDADMQDPPSLLPQMIEIIENDGYDSVATR